MARIRAAVGDQAMGAVSALSLPLDPGALNFGLAGIFAFAAGLAWYCAQAGLQRLPHLAG